MHGLGTFLGPGHESAAIAYLNTWRVPNPPPRLISSHSYYLKLLLRIHSSLRQACVRPEFLSDNSAKKLELVENAKF